MVVVVVVVEEAVLLVLVPVVAAASSEKDGGEVGAGEGSVAAAWLISRSYLSDGGWGKEEEERRMRGRKRCRFATLSAHLGIEWDEDGRGTL